jgi:hypothetical protein
MGRWFFNLAGALSLLLSAALLLLWARSHLGETVLVESAPGQLLLIGIDGPAKDVVGARGGMTRDQFVQRLGWPGGASPPAPPAPSMSEHRLLGFLLMRGGSGTMEVPHRGGGYEVRAYPFVIVGIPYWFLALLPLVFFGVWVRYTRRQRRRRRAGRCLECGYDVRATPDRCPECGTVQAAAGAAA